MLDRGRDDKFRIQQLERQMAQLRLDMRKKLDRNSLVAGSDITLVPTNVQVQPAKITISGSAVGGFMDYRGAWFTGIEYATEDVVAWNGVAYVCVQAHTSSVGVLEPDDAAYWTPLGPAGASEMDDLSDVNIGTPVANRYLRYVGSSWQDSPLVIAASDLPSEEPPTGPTFQMRGGRSDLLDADEYPWFVAENTFVLMEANSAYDGSYAAQLDINVNGSSIATLNPGNGSFATDGIDQEISGGDTVSVELSGEDFPEWLTLQITISERQ